MCRGPSSCVLTSPARAVCTRRCQRFKPSAHGPRPPCRRSPSRHTRFLAGAACCIRDMARMPRSQLREENAVEPIKVGWLGAALDGPGGGYDKIHRLAFDEATEAGLLDRPVEFVLHPENGLPEGSAKNATDGFRHLVDEGCIAVAGAYSSDNAITVGPLANELQVPLISWCGTERLRGEFCFRLGNGDCGGDAALVVAWLKRHRHERVAVLSEISPNGEEYFRFLRQECRRRDVSIAAVETVSQSPAHLAPRASRTPCIRARRARHAGGARIHGVRDARGARSVAPCAR